MDFLLPTLLCLTLSHVGPTVSDPLSCHWGTVGSGQDLPTNNSLACDKAKPSDTTSKPPGPVMQCIIFKYPTKEGPMHEGNYKADFYCDVDHLCDNAKDGVNFDQKYKNHVGDLYCCDTPLCNVEEKLKDMPFPKLCYDGPAGSAVQKSCPQKSKMCVTDTVYHVTGFDSYKEEVTYSCDTDLCAQYQISPGECHNITKQSEKKRKVCCCDSNLCNMQNTTSTTAVPGSTSVTPTPGHMTNTTHLHIPKGDHWIFVGGIVGAVMLGVLLVILFVIVFKKWKQRREERMTEYTYRQLTADLAEDPSSDEFDEALLSDI